MKGKEVEGRLTNCLELSACVDFKDLEEKIVKFFSNENLNYYISERFVTKNKTRYVFTIKATDNIPKGEIAELLGDWIVDLYEPILVEEILKNEFFECESDKKTVLKSVFDNLSTMEKIYDKKYIVKKITKYLESDNYIQLDGFIRFRLNEYWHKLYWIICEAIEEFYVEKDYNAFLILLSEYVDERQSMIDLLHIKTDSNGEYLFYDFKMSKIEVNYKDFASMNPTENFLTKDDILLSILITLAPKRIIWHNADLVKNKNITNTLEHIFKDRFSVCND